MASPNRNSTSFDTVVFVLVAAAPKLFIALIVIIAILKGCLSEEPDPIDNNINSFRRICGVVHVLDSTRNGFRISYATENAVSELRLDEIMGRASVKNGFKRLEEAAPRHFGSLLYTDIYEFADFAWEYTGDKDIRINDIFIEGVKKSKLYIGPNPHIPNSARWFNSYTEQGIQYITGTDIRSYRRGEQKIYRYWKCSGLYSTSYVDERFSHFSEDERVN